MSFVDDDYEPINSIDTEYDLENSGNIADIITKHRNPLIFVFLSIITCGWYILYFFYKCGRDMDIIAIHDGKRTHNFFGIFALSLFIIFPMYLWGWNLTNRIDAELKHRKTGKGFSSNFFYIFVLALPLICGFGIFSSWFWASWLKFSLQTSILSTVFLSIIIISSFFAYCIKMIFSMNVLSRCMIYKNIKV